MPVECKQVRKGKNVKNKATESVDNKQESMRYSLVINQFEIIYFLLFFNSFFFSFFFFSIQVILSSVQYLSYSSLLLMSLDPVGIVFISSSKLRGLAKKYWQKVPVGEERIRVNTKQKNKRIYKTFKIIQPRRFLYPAGSKNGSA